MLDKIIQFSIRNKLAVGLLTLLWVIWGIWSASKLPVDAVPDITNNQVQIITVCPTLAGQEVEQLVTFPVEQSIVNLPGLEETRSISRFGLSVVTVVFKENIDIYFARQLISERLKEAEADIPQGIGTPELAPVSTGLGEVYQYILHPREGNEDKYNAKDLREMQDWIVARQLYGIPGVAEVNSFGGEVRQYEVAVNPDRLRAMNVSIIDIFTALEKNNQNTGGAYIDKKPNAYFIRGIGLVTSLEDVGNIPVKIEQNIPVFVKDVAEVRYGSAVRYGALTYNGEVDAVGGVVMMLKGQNSNDVVRRIKEKLPAIQQSLPEDVIIEPYLDRTDLVGRTLKTVEKNLVEGALIVIFVLVLFLGNLRAGLIVASAIPLSMLFALGMMNVFGVSANLMSLGAIDFGLIVDGAVIVVEATLHHLGLRKTTRRLTQKEMDEEVKISASKIRKSAAFGEIIILIVYIPILTLVGVEGKMFTPMAQTVSFAILGALILSMTYIPMMCALFLSKKPTSQHTFSDKMMKRINQTYQPLLKKALKFKYTVVASTTILFLIALFAFSRMGGEFIPQLQEGDFAFHCILPQGTSLSQSIETSMQASRIIREFDEVKMVVGKTGAAEVPTDPMPPEATDLMIILKPQKEWASGRSYEELGNDIMNRLEAIPGVFFEKNQPIQMRFNELMTGIRQDVAVKIFGENLDTLAFYAQKVKDVVETIEGVTLPQVEHINGLPQINVEYDRTRMANYGLNVDDLNTAVSMAFAGKRAGVIYENERRFDLVVRLDDTYRGSIEDVGNLTIPTRSGLQIPLRQIANIDYKIGPAQISRDDGKRRIYVGFNLSGRDVQSVVEEMEDRLSREVPLPDGYYFTYGGQFENLQKATNRLLIAVPVSLLLIFTLLYFTFHSLKQALLIFTAIPMSAIGGVFALLLRDMPFSISAGIGFIALFGVAVLNGIVLLAKFNQLENEGVRNPLQRIFEGTKIRLRPVLMTAGVASLGFLPMALSTGAGAEVQKPLATVVIGGLLSATFLTLFVLPALYLIFYSSFSFKNKLSMTPTTLSISALLFLTGITNLHAQRPITLEDAVSVALENNRQLKAEEVKIKIADHTVKTAFELPKTEFFYENEGTGPSNPKGNVFVGIEQELAWPGRYATQKKYFQEMKELAEINKTSIEITLVKEVQSTYYTLWYLQDKHQLLQQLDSIYTSLFKTAELRYETGDAAGIDKIAAEAIMKELQAIMIQNNKEIESEQRKLMLLLNTEEWLLPVSKPLEMVEPNWQTNFENHPLLRAQEQKVVVAEKNIRLQQNSLMPDLSGKIFSQRLWNHKDPLTGFSVGVALPVFGATRSKVRLAKAEKEVQEAERDYTLQQLQTRWQQTLLEMEKNSAILDFYEDTGLKQVDEIIAAAMLSYNSGEIGFAEVHQFLNQAIAIRQNYLEALHHYNLSVIKYNYFNNN